MKGAIVLVILMIFGLAGCSGPSVSEAPVKPGTDVTPPESNGSKETKFSDYPVDSQYSGKPEKLVFNEETSEFKSRFQKAAGDDVNFAGQYILLQWGCGADCVTGGLIDAKTGNTHVMPFGICCIDAGVEGDKAKYIDFKVDSSLLIFNGLINENEEGGKVHYYEFKDSKFMPITKN